MNVLEVNSLSFPDKRTVVRQLLTKWKDTFDAEATWEKIVIALRKIGNNALAQEKGETICYVRKILKLGTIIYFAKKYSSS